MGERTSADRLRENEYVALPVEDSEQHSLLHSSSKVESFDNDEELAIPTSPKCCKGRSSNFNHNRKNILSFTATFAAGILATLAIQHLVLPLCSTSQSTVLHGSSSGSSRFPPAKPTNWRPELFPSNVGYEGPMTTGNEAGLVATAPAYPVHTGAPNLVLPSSIGGSGKPKHKKFDLFKHWGNLSPWYSVPSFGLDDATAEAPDTCRVTALHFLHRHGARYPTEGSALVGPDTFAKKIEAVRKSGSKVVGHGKLSFLTDWEYQLGTEVLTPFGRQQMYDLGVNLRIKYGYLLNNFTDTVPVFRTESQNRMVHSALNFAVGFFGLPLEGQYQNSITYEDVGLNNTLAPYKLCRNAQIPSKGERGVEFTSLWANVYLQEAHKRLHPLVEGMDLTLEDVFLFQQMCAYETVALGYSSFCEHFTEEEWEGFNYAIDLFFWYNHSFGSPVGRGLGTGYIQELVARLTNTPIPVHNTSTNSTLDDNPITFPLGNSLYVDATHEVVIIEVLTALNLTNFASAGVLPHTHIPANRTFITSQLAPFGTNIQFQILDCATKPGKQIRVILNDGVVPLTGIKGCPNDPDGMCPVDTFVAAQKELFGTIDWEWTCFGEWQVLPGTGWSTTDGRPPTKEEVGHGRIMKADWQ